jgi:gamma-glutamylcyclotransferase (GGCT)/AIG2-like uncharacterized protein YtfP
MMNQKAGASLMAQDQAKESTLILFVYGTLMRDGCRAGVLAGQRFLGRAATLSHYELYHLGAYPGLVLAREGGRRIEGELYEVERKLLPRLDRIEGAPELFRCLPVQVEGHPGPVFAYLYQQDTRRCSPCREPRWHNGPPS